MKKILLSLVTVFAVGAVAVNATTSYLVDTETSNDNTFASGELDLNIDGGNTNVVKFTVTNISPGSQRIGTWRLRNVGTINGYLDLENIVITSHENGCLDPETAQGDTSCANPGDGEGELQNLLSLSKLFWDTDCDGWVGTGESAIFDGKVGNIASHYEENKILNSGTEKCVTGQFNWWSNGDNDNLGQSDSLDLDITFELAQTTAQ